MSEHCLRLAALAASAPSRELFRDERGAIGAEALLRRVGGIAARLRGKAATVGILAPNATGWVAADFAAKWLGKTVVPLPDFFSPRQLGHVIRDAGVDLVLAAPTLTGLVAPLGVPVVEIDDAEAPPPAPAGDWRMIVYSSGTSGTPKGVRLGDRQLGHSAASLAHAVAARGDDVYLSALPLSLLLEQLCAIHVPLIAGARTVLSPTLAHQSLRGDATALAEAVERARPSVMSLVPHLVQGWVRTLGSRGRPAPDSLRLVAVGGATVPPDLARAAWRAGIPVHEGYGLTECCAVVAMNRPGERAEATVGRPLDGVRVELVDGEIVVEGPTVMDGYLRGPEVRGRWPTGDLGEFDAQGRLVVLGRKDAAIRTALGRNIHPEWLEAMLRLDPRVARCVILGEGCAWPIAVIEPSAAGRAWLRQETASPGSLVAGAMAAAPDYARPRTAVVVEPGLLGDPSLLTANGRPRRGAIAERFAAIVEAVRRDRPLPPPPRPATYARLLAETAADRQRFLEIPVLQRAVRDGVTRRLYLDFLGQAYHHVRHTCGLLEAAAKQCGDGRAWLAEALHGYIAEEQGHDLWILDDIDALGGDAAAVRDGDPRPPCAAMVAHVYRAIAERGPIAMLGMVHVLEGMSVVLAERAAAAIRRGIPVSGIAGAGIAGAGIAGAGIAGGGDGRGFRYLTSHGSLDVGHVEMFRGIVDRLDDHRDIATLIDTARAVYGLYGDLFRDLAATEEHEHAA